MKSTISGRLKAAFFCYLFSLFLSTIFSLIYLFRSEIMPYHAAIVGQSWAEIDPAFQILLLALMKATGGGWLSASIAVGILLFKLFRQDIRWAYWAIPAIGLPAMLTNLSLSIYVTRNTPASPPWMLATLGTILLLVGLILSIKSEGNTKQEEKI